ncbi:MAG: DUF934 domain-containing protein [Burkholderiales bacterium]
MKFISAHDKPRDPWHTIDGDDGPMVTLTPAPFSLLTLLQWRGVRSHWPEGMPVGVLLANDVEVSEIADDLPRLALVALQFPKWVDGRAYSQAKVLRSRYRYAGQIRAVGEVLVDMLPLLRRTGFDAVAMRADQSRDAAERALDFFHGFYQGDALDNRPPFALPPGTVEAREQEFVNAGASI